MRAMIVGIVLVVAFAFGAVSGCGDADDKCAVAQENCSASYLKANNKTGCCSGLTCQDSVVTPGARICR